MGKARAAFQIFCLIFTLGKQKNIWKLFHQTAEDSETWNYQTQDMPACQ